MRIQYLNGGLANQSFQYIFARYSELHFPQGGRVYFDDSFFFYNNIHNGYELEKVFGIKANLLSKYFSDDVWDFIVQERKNGVEFIDILNKIGIDCKCVFESSGVNKKTLINDNFTIVPMESFYPEITETKDNVYYQGYWICKKWFEAYKNIFLKEFIFPDIVDERNLMYKQKIENTISIAIHVRRGDYVNLNVALDKNIYYDYISNILKECPEATLFIFSDDIEWCKINRKELGFDISNDTVYIEGNIKGKNYIDLHLMTLCKGIVLSNSAFSYLGGLLNQEKCLWINFNNRTL